MFKAASEVTQQVQAPAAESDDINSTPGTCMTEGENHLPWSSDLYIHHCMDALYK